MILDDSNRQKIQSNDKHPKERGKNKSHDTSETIQHCSGIYINISQFKLINYMYSLKQSTLFGMEYVWNSKENALKRKPLEEDLT